MIYCKAYDEAAQYLGKESVNNAEVSEAYGYKDTSDKDQTTLVLAYDTNRSSHAQTFETYDIPESATQKTD